jgi:hypothetical protein
MTVVTPRDRAIVLLQQIRDSAHPEAEAVPDHLVAELVDNLIAAALTEQHRRDAIVSREVDDKLQGLATRLDALEGRTAHAKAVEAEQQTRSS